MKLPRWLVFALMTTSAVTIVFAVVGFWITWPDRTTRDCLALIQNGNFEETNLMLHGAFWTVPQPSSVQLTIRVRSGKITRETFYEFWQHDFREPNMQFHPRSWTDRMLGRRSFHASMSDENVVLFVTQRDEVYFVDLKRREADQPYKEFDLERYLAKQKGSQ